MDGATAGLQGSRVKALELLDRLERAIHPGGGPPPPSPGEVVGSPGHPDPEESRHQTPLEVLEELEGYLASAHGHLAHLSATTPTTSSSHLVGPTPTTPHYR
jgi:hypothetical protein